MLVKMMKKNLVVGIVIVSFIFPACSNSSNAGKDSSKNEVVTAARYECPMKCEGEKSYQVKGECPVCHMDLKEIE